MSHKLKNILITGAEGFIGSHLVEALVREGRHVRAMALYNSFGRFGWLDTLAPEIRGNIELIMGDVRDASCVRDTMQGMDAVMHLAALIAIPYSYNAPASYVDTNVMGTLNVMQAARDLGVEKIVHTSTSEVYGTAQKVPIAEDHPLVGQSPYSASKIGADQIAYSYYCSFDTPVAIARPFNTYGPRQSLRAVIPTIILQALTGGGEIALGATTPTRDFNFVSDTVSGMIAILDSEKSIGETINIGSGQEISVGDTVALIGELTGKTLSIKNEQHRLRPEASEVERLCCDAGKAKKLLGWQPTNHLRQGLEHTIDWFANAANRSHYHDIHRYAL